MQVVSDKDVPNIRNWDKRACVYSHFARFQCLTLLVFNASNAESSPDGCMHVQSMQEMIAHQCLFPRDSQRFLQIPILLDDLLAENPLEIALINLYSGSLVTVLTGTYKVRMKLSTIQTSVLSQFGSSSWGLSVQVPAGPLESSNLRQAASEQRKSEDDGPSAVISLAGGQVALSLICTPGECLPGQSLPRALQCSDLSLASSSLICTPTPIMSLVSWY